MNSKLFQGAVLITLTIASAAYAKDDLSENAQILLSLHKELQEFKDDPQFHDVGFADCCRFNKWLERVDNLNEQTDLEIMYETGFLPVELRDLGMEYMSNKGQSTNISDSLEEIIRNGFPKD